MSRDGLCSYLDDPWEARLSASALRYAGAFVDSFRRTLLSMIHRETPSMAGYGNGSDNDNVITGSIDPVDMLINQHDLTVVTNSSCCCNSGWVVA